MRFTFPQYLFPAFLFRPRQFDPEEPPHHTSHSKQKKALSRDETIQAAGKASFTYLVCKGCHTPLTNSAIISKGFAGRYGRGYLCHNVINIELGRVQERTLLTGLHTVRDVNCAVCKTSLGWKYCTAREPSQRYKMGKFLLEALNVVKLSHFPDDENEYDDREKSEESYRYGEGSEFEESRWDTRSIDLDTLPDEESRPATPVLGKQVQGNMFYDDIEDLMLGWADGNHRRRVAG